MESPSSSSCFRRLISFLFFTLIILLNFKPVISYHIFEDLYTRSRNTSSSYLPPSSSSSSPPPPPPPLSTEPPQLPPNPPSLVPALFVIGDSSVDCGTNNFLGTLARADHPPYGRDFDTHQPTGRFSNGRIPVDYLAVYLGLPLVPSYLGQSGSVEDMIHGVNYASAGAGIIFSSGSELGQHISFSHQIQQVMDTFQRFILTMGEKAAADFISNSMFYISIGTNDFIHYYLPDVSDVQSKYVSWRFTQFLARSMKQEIKNLYNANVRRVVVMGLAPIGCAPYYLWQYNSENGECVKTINNMIMEFNFVMRYTVEELNKELNGANIVFCDAYLGSMDILKNADQFGFSVTNTACCGLGRYNGWIMCLSAGMACGNASNHLWWDQFHPTSAVNEILAQNVWSGLNTKMCYPMNMKDMVAQRVT
ncbi:GDSL esterase/lipase 7 [Rutidosis leptorrhynchoides]|uniref:GDSL esterase/lipase 7 n=1 Tax=Rutidosis leptorrhynchoides TaxID=125765 RepID=UPI003A999846